MKFMEIDAGGFVHHICDDPEITIIPLVNRVSHGDKHGNPLLDPITLKPQSFKGFAWQAPLPISDADYNMLRQDGLNGITDKGTAWHYKYDVVAKTFSKVPTL